MAEHRGESNLCTNPVICNGISIPEADYARIGNPRKNEISIFKRDSFWEGFIASTLSAALVASLALIASLLAGLLEDKEVRNAAITLGSGFAIIVIALVWKPIIRTLQKISVPSKKELRDRLRKARTDDSSGTTTDVAIITATTLAIITMTSILVMFFVSKILN